MSIVYNIKGSTSLFLYYSSINYNKVHDHTFMLFTYTFIYQGTNKRNLGEPFIIQNNGHLTLLSNVNVTSIV